MMYPNELELIFHKLDGLAFQSFFNELMMNALNGFYPVRQRNDGGNDGFIQKQGIYFQVFSPESVTKSTINSGSSKLVSDFEKLLKHWHYTTPIRKYIFVINDKLKGLDRELIIRISELGKANNLQTELYTAQSLINLFNDNLTHTQQKLIIQKHTFGTSSKSAIYTASEIISECLSIKKWECIDENLSFSLIEEQDIEILNEIIKKLFSMKFLEIDENIVEELIDAINSLISIFHTELTRSYNGNRQWDNSWKRIYPNPKASYYDQELIKWNEEVKNRTFSLCRTLNKFSEHIRGNYKPDYLSHQNYTICRRQEGSFHEHVRIIP